MEAFEQILKFGATSKFNMVGSNFGFIKSAFGASSPSTSPSGEYTYYDDEASGENDLLMNVIGMVIFFYALYLAFKCKNNTGGVSIIQVILAVLFSPFYLVYRLARPC